MREQARQIIELESIDLSTRQVLFEKVTKGLDDKDFVIAEHKLRIEQLEARVQQLEPRKRRKVRTSPNSKFVKIGDIKKAQIAAGDRQIGAEDSDVSIDSDSTLSYIEIEE